LGGRWLGQVEGGRFRRLGRGQTRMPENQTGHSPMQGSFDMKGTYHSSWGKTKCEGPPPRRLRRQDSPEDASNGKPRHVQPASRAGSLSQPPENRAVGIGRRLVYLSHLPPSWLTSRPLQAIPRGYQASPYKASLPELCRRPLRPGPYLLCEHPHLTRSSGSAEEGT